MFSCERDLCATQARIEQRPAWRSMYDILLFRKRTHRSAGPTDHPCLYRSNSSRALPLPFPFPPDSDCGACSLDALGADTMSPHASLSPPSTLSRTACSLSPLGSSSSSSSSRLNLPAKPCSSSASSAERIWLYPFCCLLRLQPPGRGTLPPSPRGKVGSFIRERREAGLRAERNDGRGNCSEPRRLR